MGWLDRLIKNIDEFGDKAVKTMAAQPSYIDKLKAANPESYKQLEGLMAYTANEGNAGIPQDWQAQIFTPLQVSAPKKIETGKYVDVPEYTTDAENSPYQTGRTVKQWVQSAPEGYTPTVVDVGGDTPQYAITGYTKDLGKVNGLPVTANYDLEGNLTGYSADPAYRNWLSGSTGVSGGWDASGAPTPVQHVSSSGGFFSGFTDSALDLLTSDAGKMLMLAAGAGVLPGVSPIVAGSEAAAGLTGVDAALADLAASTPAFTGAEVAGLTGVDAALADLAASTPAFTPEVLVPELVGVDAAMADLAASTPAFTPEILAPELVGVDAALADLAASAPPEFIAPTVAAGAGLTFKEGLDAVRAGLLVNALTGDPLGLGGDTGGGGATAPSGFAQVPIPEGWKSPEYTYTPVQNVTFEDLFPGVSLQGTQWQNMPQAQTFNQLFAAGRQTPMGSPVDLNQIVGSILGQSTTG